MMQHEARRAANAADAKTRKRVLEMMGVACSARLRLGDALERAGYGQADLVLCLLRVDDEDAMRVVSRVMGRPVTVCPPVLALARGPTRARPARRTGDDRLIVRVGRAAARRGDGSRRLLGTGMYARLDLLRPGMSVRAAIERGVRKRDLRRFAADGLVELET